jgi:RNA polymerase sigma-70 factor (ECF subfamily)
MVAPPLPAGRRVRRQLGRMRYVRCDSAIEMVMGDHAAAAWRRQYGTVYRFVRRRTGSPEEAEDVTQEVFTAAIAALGDARLQAEAPPLAWLYTVARRRLIDRLRIPASLPLDADGALSAPGDERSYGPEMVRTLVEGLQRLEEGQRRVVILKVFEGRSFADIAAETGVSEEACRMRLSRGLAALRTYLVQKGVSP